MISKEERLDRLELRREELLSQLRPLEAKISANYGRIKKLKEEIDEESIEKGNYDWEWLLQEDGFSSSPARYKMCEEKLNEFGFRASGYYMDTMQRSVAICLNKNEPVTKAINGLLTILPYIKYHAVEKSVMKAIGRTGSLLRTKRVGIFEHTLSENGVYYLVFVEGNECVYLMIDKYHITSMVKRFTDLMSALEYVSEHHYYEITKTNADRVT